CLLISYAGAGRVAITYGQQQAGNLEPDPQMVFFTSCGGWLPVEILNSTEVWASYALWAEAIDHIQVDTPAGEMPFAGFTEYWADVLAALEWTFVDCRPGNVEDE